MVAAKFLMRRGGGDVVLRRLNYWPATTPAPPSPAAHDYPVFVAGANLLLSGRRVWAGEAITQ
jgi:hypothetical protein